MQAVYSIGAPRIGRVWGTGLVQGSIWNHHWRPSLRADFWRRLLAGDYLRPRVHRRTRRGLQTAMLLALIGILVGSATHRLSTGVQVRMGMTDRNAFWDSVPAIADVGDVIVVDGPTDLPEWTARPVNTDEWSAITVSNDKVAGAVFTGVVDQFLQDRPELADIRLILENANARVPHAVSMALADLSETVGASLRMGLNREEVGALARLTSEFIMSIVPTEGNYE